MSSTDNTAVNTSSIGPYRNPFLDLAATRTPRTIKEMFSLVEYFVLQTPLIKAALDKKSAYPVTSLVYDFPDEAVVNKWKSILEKVLFLPEAFKTINFNYYSYGNCFISIQQPLEKEFQCSSCDYKIKVKELENLDNIDIEGESLIFKTCPGCKRMSIIINTKDHFLKNQKKIRLKLWDPNQIGVKENPLTGDTFYTYNIPKEERDKIKNLTVKLTPKELSAIEQKYIDTALKGVENVVRFSSDAIFHMKAPSLAGIDPGWGYPVILTLIKELYLMQLMKKANEEIANEHLNPLDILFPQPQAMGNLDVFGGINLSTWQKQVVDQINKWRKDKNYKPILPIPIGHQRLTGDGKNLLTINELDSLAKYILAGLGVPQEFIFGGMSYSGSNVSLRVLENEFLGIRKLNLQLLHFIVKRLEKILDYGEIKVHFSDFKMADDSQKISTYLSLNQAGYLSLDTLMNELGLDYKKELEKRIDEAEELKQLQEKERIAQVFIEAAAKKVQQEAEAILRKQLQDLTMDESMVDPLTGQQKGGSPQTGKTSSPPKKTQELGQLAAKSTDKQVSTQQIKENPKIKPPKGPGSQI